MLGSLLAGTDESPGEVIFERGEGYKEYRGMGSLRAMMGRGFSRDRYRQEHITDPGKLVAEGVEARVPYRGPLERLVNQLVGGLRAGMGYLGAEDVGALRGARMVRVTNAGQYEGQPHSVEVMEAQPFV
jgi:IMP dehydrogenase